MTEAATLAPGATRAPALPAELRSAQTLTEHIVEVISDSGEGAQRCGQSLGAIAARTGNGIWTTEIIPAEIQPPARSVAGASGIRIRIGTKQVTNGGDETDLVVAFNEQVLLGRVRAGELKSGAQILLESMWREHRDPKIVESYAETVAMLKEAGFRVYEVPLERECHKLVADPRKGKNMFVLGILCNLYSLEPKLGREQIALTFGKKDAKVIQVNQGLFDAGFLWAERNFDFKYRIPAVRSTEPQIVVNGNTALALGVLASGMDICAMYPITPATSVSHYLSDVFERVGGIVHQAEDEIAACAFAIGASYAGRCAVTVTSGPGYSLKQEGIGLAVMAEIPLVVINVQRGGPSTGQPTKVEQGDLLTTIYGSHGDAPKVVMAVSGIEDCFYSMITARKIAETFNTVVVVLSDASLATAQQPFPRPQFDADWLAPPLDQTPVPEGIEALRLGPADRHRAPLRAGSAARHAHADRSRARSRQQGRLRSGDQRGGAAQPQPQDRRAAEDAEDAAGVRRSGRRSAGRRLGQHEGRDRGSGRADARGRMQGVIAASHVHPADAVGHSRDPQALQARDDHRGQLGRPPGGRADRRGQPALRCAGDDAARTLPRRRRLLDPDRAGQPIKPCRHRARAARQACRAVGLAGELP